MKCAKLFIDFLMLLDLLLSLIFKFGRDFHNMRLISRDKLWGSQKFIDLRLKSEGLHGCKTRYMNYILDGYIVIAVKTYQNKKVKTLYLGPLSQN